MMIDSDEYQKEKYIAFVDVLGFSEMVNNFKFNKYYDFEFNGTGKDTFHVVNDYYHKVLKEMICENNSPLEITTISDCMIVSSKTLEPLLVFLYYYQSNMIYNDAANARIVTRGYLTKGNFVHDQKKNLIVGEAYQRAVKGEKNTKYPRVEIDKIVFDEIQVPFDILVTIDPQDSKYYINYLIREKFVDMYCRTPLENFIDDKIKEYENNEEVQPKYIWLKTYHERIKNYQPTKQECENFNCLFHPIERDI